MHTNGHQLVCTAGCHCQFGRSTKLQLQLMLRQEWPKQVVPGGMHERQLRLRAHYSQKVQVLCPAVAMQHLCLLKARAFQCVR